MKLFLLIFICLFSSLTMASQKEEALSHSVSTALRTQIDKPFSEIPFSMKIEASSWVAKALPYTRKLDPSYRRQFLELVFYEATRAGLDPWLVMAVISIESNFNRYATSSVGAQGFMQVMPFWVKSIGDRGQNLYTPSINIRYGCTILRFYLSIEHGNLSRALARYNGSLGKNEYPNAIFSSWRKLNEPSLMAYNQ